MKQTPPQLWSLLTALLIAAASAQGQLEGCSADANPWQHVVDLDFEPLAANGITQEQIESVKQFSGGGMHVLVVNNTVYAKAFGRQNPVIFGHGMLHLLLRAMCYHDLPDVEFMLDPEDGLYATDHTKPLPVLAWSINRLFPLGIHFPYWSFNTVEALHKDNLPGKTMPWEDKISKAVWRGSTTGGVYNEKNWRSFPRSQLVQHAMQAPEILDVAFSSVHVQASAAASEAMLKHSKVLPGIDHGGMSRHKIIIIADGNAAPSQRMAALMFSGSAFLKQESPWSEFYYSDLKPYHHYIPLSYYMSDVVSKVRAALHHDHQLKLIAQNAREYAETKFTAPNIACYIHRILLRYASLQKFTPQLDDDWRKHELHIGQQVYAGHMQHSSWNTCKRNMSRYI